MFSTSHFEPPALSLDWNQPGILKNHKTVLEQWKTNPEPWKTDLESWKAIKTDLEPWKTNTGGSDDFSLQTNRHFIIIHISSASSSSGADHYDRVDPTLPLMVFIQANFAHTQRFIYKPYIIYFILLHIHNHKCVRLVIREGSIEERLPPFWRYLPECWERHQRSLPPLFIAKRAKVGVKDRFRIFV